MEISFTSTFRINLRGKNMTDGKRQNVKALVSKYQNYRYPNGNDGSVRISIRHRLDEKFENNLRRLGVTEYQKFNRHNVPKTNDKMDIYIKSELDAGNYKQYGKQNKRKQ